MFMTQEQFRRLTSIQQVELIFDQGNEIGSRIYIFYNIRLFLLFDFFVEIWYIQTTNRIDRIVILSITDVLDIYERDIQLGKLFD
jgi:hypothetical protein